MSYRTAKSLTEVPPDPIDDDDSSRPLLNDHEPDLGHVNPTEDDDPERAYAESTVKEASTAKCIAVLSSGFIGNILAAAGASTIIFMPTPYCAHTLYALL